MGRSGFFAPAAPVAYDDNYNDDDDGDTIDGYVFVVLIVAILVCGCLCLALNLLYGEDGSGAGGGFGALGLESGATDRDAERARVMLRDSVAEVGECARVTQ